MNNRLELTFTENVTRFHYEKQTNADVQEQREADFRKGGAQKKLGNTTELDRIETDGDESHCALALPPFFLYMNGNRCECSPPWREEQNTKETGGKEKQIRNQCLSQD